MAYDLFRKRMSVKGATAYERRMNNAKRSFQQWFEQSLARELIKIDGVEQYAVMQDQNQSNNKDLSDDKYLILENSTNARVGSIIEWRDKIGMIFTAEEKTIPTHKQFKFKMSNHVIKWMIGDKICNNGNGYPAYVQNQTLYTLGVSTSGNHIWIVNAKMMMYMQDNDETRAIQIGQRIVIGGQVYQVMFKDYVSRQGLINYLLEQDMVSLDRDNLELGVADYYNNKSNPTDDKPTGIAKEVIISGSDKAKIGSTLTYDASVFQDGSQVSDDIVEWTIADTESVATVTEQTTKSVTIRIESNFQKVGSVITVIGKTADGVIGSKSVKIVSPY